MPRSARAPRLGGSGARNFRRRPAQCRLRLDVELARQIGGGEQQVAHFLLDHRRVGALDRARLRARRSSSASFGITARASASQSRCEPRAAKSWRRAAARAGRAPPRRGRLRRRRCLPLGGLVRFPGLVLRRHRSDLGIAEHMRMTPFHLVGDRLGNVAKAEQPGFLGHPGVEHDLEQQIPSSSFNAACRCARSRRRPRRLPRSCRARSSRILVAVHGQPRAGSRSRAMIASSRSIGRVMCCSVLCGSFDPQIAAFVPVLDRQRRIAFIALVIGPDLRLDPIRLVAQ